MKQKNTPWEVFQCLYIETGWFDYDRIKTLRAIKRVWEAMSEEDLNRLPSLLTIFAPSPDKLGEVFPFFDQGLEREGAFIYLAPYLEDEKQGRVDSIVAHEFAHAIFKHAYDKPGIRIEEASSEQKDAPHEIEADKLVEEWGFAPGYKRSKRRAK